MPTDDRILAAATRLSTDNLAATGRPRSFTDALDMCARFPDLADPTSTVSKARAAADASTTDSFHVLLEKQILADGVSDTNASASRPPVASLAAAVKPGASRKTYTREAVEMIARRTGQPIAELLEIYPIA
jgi:hypothetical protein